MPFKFATHSSDRLKAMNTRIALMVIILVLVGCGRSNDSQGNSDSYACKIVNTCKPNKPCYCEIRSFSDGTCMNYCGN